MKVLLYVYGNLCMYNISNNFIQGFVWFAITTTGFLFMKHVSCIAGGARKVRYFTRRLQQGGPREAIAKITRVPELPPR